MFSYRALHFVNRNRSYVVPKLRFLPHSKTTEMHQCVPTKEILVSYDLYFSICKVRLNKHFYITINIVMCTLSACTESTPGQILKCNDSQRCLDESLKCDYYFSQNCKSMGFPGDKSDQTRDAPAYCFRKL